MVNIKYKNIFFIGIGGISMSGLAEILLNHGCSVSGSDITASYITKQLQEKGIEVFIGHRVTNIGPNVELVVYTAAIKEDNPELIYARSRGLTIIDRAGLLGYIMKQYKYSIAVAGSHGKTTTSSMLTEILIEANVSPTVTVGGIINKLGSTTKIGNSQFFLAEACEYCDSFLKFYPYVGLILNIDMDHSDYFRDIFHVRESFKKFVNLIPADGALIINSDIDDFHEFIKDVHCNIITYGFSNDALWRAEDISYNDESCASFQLMRSRISYGRVNLKVIGKINILNALASCAAANYLDIDIFDILNGLNKYAGTKRRFEYKGSVNGCKVYDDYAHHPTEIKATLEGAVKFSYNKLWCIFQPHTYTRTKTFLDEFSKSFSRADKIIITDIYAAREPDPHDISAEDLVSRMINLGVDALYIKEFSDIENYLIHNLTNNDMLITMGAGDVYLIGERLLNNTLSTLSTDLSTGN